MQHVMVQKYGTLVASGGRSASQKVLDAVALNASAATRTFALDVQSMSKLLVWVDFTYAAATTVVLTPSASPNGGTLYGRVTSTAVAAGAGTVSLYTDTYTTGAASAIFLVEYDVRGMDYFKVVFSGASAGASDLVTVYCTGVCGI